MRLRVLYVFGTSNLVFESKYTENEFTETDLRRSYKSNFSGRFTISHFGQQRVTCLGRYYFRLRSDRRGRIRIGPVRFVTWYVVFTGTRPFETMYLSRAERGFKNDHLVEKRRLTLIKWRVSFTKIFDHPYSWGRRKATLMSRTPLLPDTY